jgi:hypothetical protein
MVSIHLHVSIKVIKVDNLGEIYDHIKLGRIKLLQFHSKRQELFYT